MVTLQAAARTRAPFMRGRRGARSGRNPHCGFPGHAHAGIGDGPLFLHAGPAAMMAFVRLLGASVRRTIAILPHAQPACLPEVGADAGFLLTAAGDLQTLTCAGDDAVFDAYEDHRPMFFIAGSASAPKQAQRAD